MSTANIIGNAIFGLRNKSGGNYINPAVKESLVGLWKFDQNTNESPTRNIIKNTIKDKGGDLELLNFGYKLNSGYNGYATDFTEWHGTYSNKTQTKITVSIDIYFPISIISFKNVTSAPSFRIKVSGLPKGQNLYYKYINEEGLLEEKFNIPSDGIYTLPATAVSDTPTTVATLANEQYNINIKGLTIEQLPLYEGALVTDGKDDMIVSQKTVQEMLGGSKEITVVSMIHQIGRVATNTNLFTNCIQYNTGSKGHNIVNYQTSLGKTGIYGYSRANVSVANNEVVINNILGDKADYLTNVSIGALTSNEKFSVVGYLDVSPQQVTSVAVYWTFIANKVLTTDEINQIIAYFKLDKYVTPQVIYDVKRQGLTNDTPAADWYLKDFSGNGHDMQLYNFAKKLGSGIGKYEVDFNTWAPQSYVADSTHTSNKLHITNIKGGNAVLYTNKGVNAMKIKITGIQSFNLVYRYIAENDVWGTFEIDRDGIYELPVSITTTKTYYTGFTVPYYTGDCDITIEQIPDYEGALVSDGIDDYGKVENLPIYKDYTVAIDRAWTNDLVKAQCLTSKLNGDNFGSFSFELIENGFSSYSFGISNKGVITIDSNKKISYQSKYVYNGSPIISGNNVDGKDLFLFRNRDSYPYYAEAAIWSYILFPYSLSEFLLERQLKKYKLGTLYPGMIEWRPIFNINVDIDKYNVVNKTTNKQLSIGDYFAITDTIELQVYLTDKEGQEITSLTINGKSFTPTFIDVRYLCNIKNFGKVTGKKSPQKINITIDEYIRYEDIVQPYPAIINLKQDGKTITWGDKLKVGSDIVFAGSANLLPELYTVSETRYNGVTLYPNTIIKVEKSMVFDNARTYLKANEPSCILSHNRLRIPNSSYKILGYIPDLTGKGNHGKLNNFAYAFNSGANGYTENYSVWRTANTNIVITDSKIKATGKLTSNFIAYTTASINKHKIKITGIPNGDSLRYSYILDGVGKDFYIIEDGVYDIPASDAFSSGSGFLISNLSSYDWSNITIEEIGEHEGSICFDGTDDYITIPTLAHGAKQVLMKVNLQSYDRYLYDQRNSWSPYLAIVLAGKTIAYEYSNKGGKTYIDGILNEHIIDKDLLNITHNITATNANIRVQYAPNIGTSFARGNFTQMALFDFMLFPDISSEEEIKELNDIIGIEGGYVESPDYYFDSFGKSNVLDDDIDNGIKNIADSRKLLFDKSITGLTAIEQTNADGAVGRIMDRALQAYNFAYNEESGYVDNGLVSDGVDDNLKNTNMPVLTDYTWIMKRKRLNDKSGTTLCHKGNGSNTNAFLFEFIEGTTKVRSFGADSTVVFPDLISWQTKNSYNGQTIASGTSIDGNALHIFMGSNVYPYYTKAVFYKAMLYSKTIDQLSINMLKNLFKRDELIDVNNPIFKKEELTKIGF